MNVRSILWTGLILLAGPAAAQALEPFSASYEVWIDGKRQGISRMRLESLGDTRWHYRVHAEGTAGLARLADAELKQDCEFELVDGRPRLLTSHQRSTSLFRDREVRTRFDWQRGSVHWDGDVKADRRGPVSLHPDAVTDALLNLQLGLDSADAAPGSVLRYHRYERGKALPVEYRVGSTETVRVPYGELNALPLRQHDTDKDRITSAWYAADLPPTPLRITRSEAGEVRYELRLIELTR